MLTKSGLRADVRELVRSLDRLSANEEGDFAGSHLQPERDALHTCYQALFRKIDTGWEADFNPEEDEGVIQTRQHIIALQLELDTQLRSFPVSGPLGMIAEWRRRLLGLELMHTIVSDSAREAAARQQLGRQR